MNEHDEFRGIYFDRTGLERAKSVALCALDDGSGRLGLVFLDEEMRPLMEFPMSPDAAIQFGERIMRESAKLKR